MKNQKPFSIVIVILFASIGYLIFPLIIKSNLVQYSTLPEKITVKIFDDSLQKNVFFNLPVQSKLSIDTLGIKNDSVCDIVDENILFHENPVFLVWLMLISVMLTIAAGSFPFFIGQIQLLVKRFHLRRMQVLQSIAISVIIAALLIISNLYVPGYYNPPAVLNDFNILLKHGDILKLIEVTTTFLVFPAFILIFLTAIASDTIGVIKVPSIPSGLEDENERKLRDELIEKSKASIVTAAKNFDFLNQLLRNGLQLLAIVVVFSVIDSGVLGKSVNAVLEIKGMEVYPAEICYVYGMFFSLFLCVIYFPVFFYLKNKYNLLKDSISDIEESEVIKDEKWFQYIWTKVKFEGSALDNLKVALTVLAPVLSSFLPESLHFFK